MKLKFRRVLTPSQIKRTKLSGGVMLLCLFAQMLTSTVINAVMENQEYVPEYAQMDNFEGPFVWQGH
jgi:hypothetical protein